MRYLSVCSGIGADAVAWRPLGWECAAFAEIDGHASSVLAHHYPDVPNLGDFTAVERYHIEPIDLVVGGTPCQSFSVAGLRKGLDDDRGNLALQFIRLVGRLLPRWVVWENVPGVLSAATHQAPDLRAPKHSMATGRRHVGDDDYEANETHAFSCLLAGFQELGYGFAYRTLDAQFVRVESHPRAVPQRRRRVFLVGHLGDWRPPAAVLLEPEGLRRNPPPRREAGSATSALTSAGVGTCGADDNQAQGGHLIVDAAPPLTGNPYGDNASRDGLLVSYGGNRTSGPRDVAAGLLSHGPRQDFESETFVVSLQERAEAPNPDSGPNGKGWRDDGTAYTLESRARPQSVAFAQNSRNELRLEGGDGQVAGPLNQGGGKPGQGDKMVATPAIHSGAAVRRITPTEAERLMGLPDGYTAVPHCGKPMADGPRYKLLGNSIAINCLSWVGERIAMFEEVTKDLREVTPRS